MSPNPPSGAFPHQHDDPRGLVERIQAQIAERIAEALDMAALQLMVDLRQRHGRPAPETTRDADRKEFEEISADLLAHLHGAFLAELAAGDRADMEHAENGQQSPLLAGQVFLARRLPDYWQRFEVHAAAYAKTRLGAPPPKDGWLGRLFRS